MTSLTNCLLLIIVFGMFGYFFGSVFGHILGTPFNGPFFGMIGMGIAFALLLTAGVIVLLINMLKPSGKKPVIKLYRRRDRP